MNARARTDGDAEQIEMKVEEAARPSPSPAVPPPAAPEAPKRRKGLRTLLMLVVPVVLAVGGGYWWVTGGRYQETDNANLRQARVTIAVEASGRIAEANLFENKAVKAGDVLFVVDPEPYRIALEQAEAALAGARLQVEQLRAAYSKSLAQESIARDEVTYLQGEFARQTTLTEKGIGTRSALDAAKRDLDKAREELVAAQQGILSARAGLGGDPAIETDKHPSILAALAARDKAAWQLGQTTVRAPADGIISQASSFKPGQLVSQGTPLFSLVETSDAWVEANFKETQLTHMRLGQKAEVWLDTYPDRPFEATVESIGAGTGAEFSLLPAQNATGNWVKVTQRIPVRLKLETGDVETAMALRTGMSATVEVDTGHARGVPQVFTGLLGTSAAAGE